MTNDRAALREALEWGVEQGAPSVAVQVSDADGTWFDAVGKSDLVTGAEREPGEQLHTGSISKAFTAVAALNLAAEGRLSLDDTVEKWLPGTANGNGYDGSTITLRHLLNNTSGLFATGMAVEVQNRYNKRSAFDKHRHDVWEIDDVLKLAVSEPPVGEPGEKFWYSNGGFGFAGAIIERASGASLESEVERAVRPLGLANTFMRERADEGYRGPHPKAYSKLFVKEGVRPEDVTAENWQSMMEGPELEPFDTTDVNTSGGYGAANVVSNFDDLLVFYKALITGSLLPQEQNAELWNTVSTKGGYWMLNSRYGLGVCELTLSDGQKVRGGGGQSFGTITLVLGSPDGERMVAMHTNNDWLTFPVFDRITEAVFGANGIGLEG
ncbi:serine hydrolase domain-containing protein [Stackebrandtia nassauensis]|nr:serine hydrolase domain-containing protein [Stackebrandtia nassauensis]